MRIVRPLAQVGSRATHVVTLTNASRVAAEFQWACGGAGAFGISDVFGVLPALLPKSIVVTFAPTAAGNYYRRLVCLVRDADPVWVDVMGTAYSSSQVREGGRAAGATGAVRWLACCRPLPPLCPSACVRAAAAPLPPPPAPH